MGFNVIAFLYTLGCCLISIFIAGKSQTKDYQEWFDSLKHPDNALLSRIMRYLGVIVYLMFGFILYNVIVNNDIVSIVLTVVVILLLGLSPLLLQKTKNLKVFFYAMLIFPVILLVLAFFLLQTNLVFAILVTAYFLWILYEMSYFYRLMKLNK
jgi:tryptophan-rich sensory protein